MSLLPPIKMPFLRLKKPTALKANGIKLLGLPLRVLPTPLINVPLTQVINRLFKAPIEEGDFDFLEDHCLKIHITDMAISFYIRFDGNKLYITAPTVFDVEFRGDSAAFLKLARRQEDPDTLFFQRHLMIEGDTELGLGVKNLLDSLELEQMPAALQQAIKIGQRVMPQT